MTTKPNMFIFLGSAFFILTWLFVGIYRDDEFYEPNLFTKYRPTYKVTFYSPIGMQDLEISDLKPERRLEEVAFQDFVIKQGIQNNDNSRLWYLPFVLFQLTLTFLLFGIEKIRRTFKTQVWQVPVHFIICLILTSLAVGYILVLDNKLTMIFGWLIILAINYWSVVLLTRRSNTTNIEAKPTQNRSYNE